jgi:homoserine dehydrogenase
VSLQLLHASLAVDLYGYGQVGRALLPRLEQHQVALASIHDSKGLRASRPVEGRRVLVDATAPRYAGPEAEGWIERLEDALRSGTSVVTCNKAPLALAWPRLVRAADRGGSVLALSATVGGGTPVLAFLRRLHATHGVVRVEASLSGTLSFVLDRAARGQDLAAAVRQAQRSGFAEPDPTLDLDGTDAYAKAIIVHNRLFPTAGPLTLADRAGRLQLDEASIADIAAQGLVPQVVATVAPGRVALELQARSREDAFLAPPGNAAVTATTQRGEVFHITGPGAGPAVTASSLLGDVLALREREARQGWGLVP